MSDVTPLSDNELQDTPLPRAAKSDATGARNGDLAPRLEAVIDAWPDLPDEVRTQIVAMVSEAAVEYL